MNRLKSNETQYILGVDKKIDASYVTAGLSQVIIKLTPSKKKLIMSNNIYILRRLYVTCKRTPPSKLFVLFF